MNLALTDKVCVVTGSAKSIGLGIAPFVEPAYDITIGTLKKDWSRVKWGVGFLVMELGQKQWMKQPSKARSLQLLR